MCVPFFSTTVEFVDLARRYEAAIVFHDAPEYPAVADVTADFVYARLMQAQANRSAGYTKPALAAWARRAGQWASGGMPQYLACTAPAIGEAKAARDVYIYFINGAKLGAPAAALALLAALGPATM